MKTGIANFNTAIAEIADTPTGNVNNPMLTTIKFVFADDKGAALSTSHDGLLQGIKAEDFDEVIQTAINMPIKMAFRGARSRFTKDGGLGNHVGSVPVGHITNMVKFTTDDGTNQLIASAVLYGEEYPNEVQYLKDKYDAGEPPGLSYEMKYSDSIIENGVEWLKKMVTKAATFVKSPAYGKRTALIALASNSDISDEDFAKELYAIINPTPKEGTPQMDEKDTKIKELETQLEAQAATKSELQTVKADLATALTAVETLTARNTELERNALVETRMKAYTDAGLTLEADAEKATKRKDFLTSMTDEMFASYIEDLKALATKVPAAPPKDALASFRPTPAIPRIDPPVQVTTDTTSLREQMRGLSRG